MSVQDITPEFSRQVYELVATIPVGKVATYGQIAQLASHPGEAREVGVIMSRTPRHLNLPCHRVVNQLGTLAPDYAFGGQEAQRALLEAEGILFLSDGRIDMNRHLWGGNEQLSFL